MAVEHNQIIRQHQFGPGTAFGGPDNVKLALEQRFSQVDSGAIAVLSGKSPTARPCYTFVTPFGKGKS